VELGDALIELEELIYEGYTVADAYTALEETFNSAIVMAAELIEQQYYISVTGLKVIIGEGVQGFYVDLDNGDSIETIFAANSDLEYAFEISTKMTSELEIIVDYLEEDYTMTDIVDLVQSDMDDAI
jgi:hypothetical protein